LVLEVIFDEGVKSNNEISVSGLASKGGVGITSRFGRTKTDDGGIVLILSSLGIDKVSPALQPINLRLYLVKKAYSSSASASASASSRRRALRSTLAAFLAEIVLAAEAEEAIAATMSIVLESFIFKLLFGC
jgi:hypothetical protein